MGGRTAGSPDIAPKVRGAFKRALLMLDEKRQVDEAGQGLAEVLCESLQENPIGTLGAVSKFCPKELDVNAEVDGEIHITWQT